MGILKTSTNNITTEEINNNNNNYRALSLTEEQINQLKQSITQQVYDELSEYFKNNSDILESVYDKEDLDVLDNFIDKLVQESIEAEINGLIQLYESENDEVNDNDSSLTEEQLESFKDIIANNITVKTMAAVNTITSILSELKQIEESDISLAPENVVEIVEACKSRRKKKK